MGKAQKKKEMRRHNPVRVPDSHLPKGLDAASKTSSKKDAVLPIIQKLEGGEAQDRTWACSAVSNLIQNDPSTRRLLQGKNIVGILISKLSDSVDEVVVEAAGALRNLCIDAGYDVCAEMFNKNIISPLKDLIPKISSALDKLVTSPTSAPENTTELVFNLAENVITILWCLSETSNKALNAINELHLAPFLMAFLENRAKLSSRTTAAAAQCLYVLTDDNFPVIADVRSNSSFTSCLVSIATTSEAISGDDVAKLKEGKEMAEARGISLRILCAGILRNISPIPAPSAASSVDIDRSVVLPLLLPVLSSVSLVDASARVSHLVSTQSEDIGTEKLSIKNAPKSDHRTPAEIELDFIETKLRNIQLSLEILTGVCATLPDPDFAKDASDDTNDDEEEDDDAMDADEGDDGDETLDAPIDAETDTTPAVPDSNTALLPSILPPLLTLIQPTPLSFPPLPSTSAAPLEEQPKTHAPTTSALASVHISALECLNNIFLSLGVAGRAGKGGGTNANLEVAKDVDAGKRVWDGVWAALALVGLEGVGVAGQERRKEMWEIAVGVLWGVGGIWKGSIVPNEEQVKVLIQLCDSTSEGQLRVKAIGALECLAQHQPSIEANKVISTYFLSIISTPLASSSTSPEPIIQAASALIDIYSDENSPYDVNFRQGGFFQALSTALPNVKKAVKSIDRKKEGGRLLRGHGEEVLDNLRGFIKYRSNLKF
ncbi:ARM repeat-containing protein [Schizopora paradoxa]|uniref:ARM repeat-containing protein n=1 Tax=Schizopora paradoxa TaxID=27342 RepID=A0A0H2RQE0_9AGAM|nr:ARM repeat-containing protein [Schizopora paradoxa]